MVILVTSVVGGKVKVAAAGCMHTHSFFLAGERGSQVSATQFWMRGIFNYIECRKPLLQVSHDEKELRSQALQSLLHEIDDQ